MKALIKELVECYGPTGREDAVRKIIREKIAPFVDDIQTDAMGNLIVRKGSKSAGGKRVMIAGHMDEIGVIVTAIDEKGFLRFAPIGGLNPHTCVGGRVRFADGRLGVIYMELPDDYSKVTPLNRMYIDIGCTMDKNCPVRVGDIAVFDREFVDLGDRMVSKAMDDRIAVAIMIESIRTIGKSPNELVYVFTVQEEVGLRGAEVSAYGVDPEIGIAVDVTGVGDTPNHNKLAMALDKGPTVKVYDPYLVAHPGLVKWMLALAEKHKIPCQREVLTGGGTDAGAIQLTRSGVPATCISIPTRYIHSPSEMVSTSDVENAIKLLNAVLSSKIEIE